MCIQWMKIRSTSYHAPKELFVPCGKCYECRQMNQSAWEFRFRAEVDEYVYRHNWQMGFITLTYNDENLPYLPPHVFKGWNPLTSSSPNYYPVPCFNKEHIRKLVHGLRKYLHKKYDVTRLIYLCCSEFGSSTKRPHYHCCFVFPPHVPAFEFYSCIQDLWTGTENFIEQPRKLCGKERIFDLSKRRLNLGFICPRQFDGYGREKPFMVAKGDVVAAAKYAAKYTCKDLTYLANLPYDLLNTKKAKIVADDEELEPEDYSYTSLSTVRDYLPFHFQTRSLGFGILQNKSNDELLTLYKYGLHFVGDKSVKPHSLPLYIKNKLVFEPYYIINEDGTRLVRRRASEFFNQNYKEIFEKKVDFYEGLIKKLSDKSYYFGCGVPLAKSEKWALEVKNLVNSAYNSPRDFAEHHVLYYGLARDKCYHDDDKALVYLNRYCVADSYDGYDELKILSYPFWCAVQNVSSISLGLLKWTIKQDKTDEEKLIDLIADYHKHLDESAFESCGYVKGDNEYGF